MNHRVLAVLGVSLMLAGMASAWKAVAQDAAAPSVAPAPAAPAAPAPTAPAPGGDEGRYSFHRVQDSFVRLDGRTGEVSVCGREVSGWTCRAVPDERAALEETIGRLQGDNAALKRELLARGLPLPSGVKPDPPPAARGDKGADKPTDTGPSPKLPGDAELDRVMGFIEKVWRRLVELMADFQRDMQRKG